MRRERPLAGDRERGSERELLALAVSPAVAALRRPLPQALAPHAESAGAARRAETATRARSPGAAGARRRRPAGAGPQAVARRLSDDCLSSLSSLPCDLARAEAP